MKRDVNEIDWSVAVMYVQSYHLRPVYVPRIERS